MRNLRDAVVARRNDDFQIPSLDAGSRFAQEPEKDPSAEAELVSYVSEGARAYGSSTRCVDVLHRDELQRMPAQRGVRQSGTNPTQVASQRRFNMKCKRLCALTSVVLATLLHGLSPALAANAPTLGPAESFAILGGSTVTNTGTTAIAGDLGVSPGTAVTGFPPGTVVGGTIHSNDTLAQQAQSAINAAYAEMAAQAVDTDLTGQDLGGLTLRAGVYRFATSAQLTGTLTLDSQGNPDAVFIFQIGSTLTTAASSSVLVINGGAKCNVFWQVGTSVTLGAANAFTGNIVALASITLSAGSTVTGRALARDGAVSLAANNVSICPLSGGSTGDPHLRTFDGLAYDFQSCGDFLLTSRPSRAFEVQVRQEPWGSTNRVSVNTALAVRAGRQTVTISPDGCTWVGGYPEGCVMVEGNAAEFRCELDQQRPGCGRTFLLADSGWIDEALPTDGPASGSERPKENASACMVSYTVRLFTGEKVLACVRGGHMDVSVEVLPAGREPTTGLLGNADGDPTNDLQIRGGGTLPLTPHPYFDVFYGTYGESWRVSAEESLFDSALEMVRDCPSGPFQLDELSSEVRDRATQVCRGVGVHPGVLDDCVMDVAVMGDDSAFGLRGIGAPRAVVVLRHGGPCGASASEDCGPVVPAEVGCGCGVAGRPGGPFALVLLGVLLAVVRNAGHPTPVRHRRKRRSGMRPQAER